MFEKLIENPVFALLTGLTGILAAVNNFIGMLSFPPFWSDVLFASLMLAFTAYWMSVLIITVKRNQERRRNLPTVGRFNGLGGVLLLLAVLVGLCAWSSLLPLEHLKQPRWHICGTFIAACSHKLCIQAFDEKGRKILNRCSVVDDAGYLDVGSRNWWTYRPDSVTAQCGDTVSAKVGIDSHMLDQSCTGVIKLP